jgi:hypothetical protein
MSKWLHSILALLMALLLAPAAHAEPTEIVVRTISRDAKFIGTSMGGMQIILRDAETGEILAQGVTSGATGDTNQIMNSQGRRAVLVNPDAAAFRATLDIDTPRLVEVEATGPLGHPQAATRVTARQWIIPGRHIRDGNGWLLEVPGFVVDLLDPPSRLSLHDAQSIVLSANVRLMCGCPIEPGGLWNATGYEVRAMIQRNEEDAGSQVLAYAGQTSQFSTALNITAPGAYVVTVFAYDPITGNTGLDRTAFVVDP